MSADARGDFHLADLFEAVARAVPEREAVVAGRTRLTYPQLDRAANGVARELVRTGIVPGDRVGICAANRAEFLIALLGAIKAAAVPLNINPRYTGHEMAQVLADCTPAVVFADATAANALMSAHCQRIVRVDEPDALGTPTAQPPALARSGDDLFLVYTGGTTGVPRGVMWTHRALLFGALGGGHPGRPPIATPADLLTSIITDPLRFAVASPLAHGTAQWGALGALLLGATVVLDPSPHFDPARLLALLAKEEVAYLAIVGDAFAQPLCEALAKRPGHNHLDSLTVILSGGAPLRPRYAHRLNELLPGAIVVDGFGASETGGFGNSVLAPTAQHTEFELDESSAVLDDNGDMVAIGETGRLARRGHIPLGYWNDPAATARTFPIIAGERWALSGDRARRTGENTIELLGRDDRCINTGGEKVDASEVERALCAVPGIDAALVVGVAHERFGETVGAVLVRTDATAVPNVETGQLAAHLRNRLADYKVPRVTCHVDKLHYTSNGKPDYEWARNLLNTAPAKETE